MGNSIVTEWLVPSYTNEDLDNPDYGDFIWKDQDDDDEYEEEDSVGYVPPRPPPPRSSFTRMPAKKGKSKIYKRPPLSDSTALQNQGGFRRLRIVAQRHLKECPEDWTDGSQPTVCGLLIQFMSGNEKAMSRAYEVFQTLKFREKAMDYRYDC